MIACLNKRFNSIGQAWEHRNFSMELEGHLLDLCCITRIVVYKIEPQAT